jgi:hypothetical protein
MSAKKKARKKMAQGNNDGGGPVNPVAQGIGPDDVVGMIQVVLTKDGRVLLNYPQGNLPLALQLLAKGVEIAAGIVKEQVGEPRRVMPVPGLPPGMLRG